MYYDIFIVMKKIVKLTESDLVRIVQRVIQEGKTDKGVKEKDSDVKIERFQDTIKNFIKSHDCKVKQVGDDFEIHSDGEHVGQVMFRKDGITVKKQGSKFGKEFDFNELGKVKSEIKKLTESDLTRIVKRVIEENDDHIVYNYFKVVDKDGETISVSATEKGTKNELTFVDGLLNMGLKLVKISKQEYDDFDGEEDDDDNWDDDEKTHNAFVQKIDDKIEFLLNGDYDNEPEYMEELYGAIVKLANKPTRKRAISYIENKLK